MTGQRGWDTSVLVAMTPKAEKVMRMIASKFEVTWGWGSRGVIFGVRFFQALRWAVAMEFIFFGGATGLDWSRCGSDVKIRLLCS